MMNSVLFLFLFFFQVNVEGVQVLVSVEDGWLAGQRLELVTKDGYYYSFKGIPYAAPPVGKLRFKAPQPPLPWQEIKNATKHGSKCIQYDIFAQKLTPSSEDCLFLNVYSPDVDAQTPLPVMFFIHGGGYESDSGNVENYGPDFLVQNGVVLVTFNYRLEVLGFLSLENEDVPGNAGLKDQVFALKWVKKNIAKFGGDPENITVFGQSAGGASTILHLVSPMSKGLFKRAISMSGVPSCDWSIAYQPRRRAFILGKQLGLDTNDPKKLLEFLQTVPAEKLAGVYPNVLAIEESGGNNTIKMFHFTPVIENNTGKEHFLIADPKEIIKNGSLDIADIMIGQVQEEGLLDLALFKEYFLKIYSQFPELFVPRKMLYKLPADKILEISDTIIKHYFGSKILNNDTMREFLTYINDSTYGYDIYRYIKIISKAIKGKIFVYNFSGISERNIYAKLGEKNRLFGATHLDDTAYLFDPKRANLTLNETSKEYKMVMQTTKLFTNFAAYGNPTPDFSLGATWPAYDDLEPYLDIGESLIEGKCLNCNAAAFWKTVFDQAGLDFL